MAKKVRLGYVYSVTDCPLCGGSLVSPDGSVKVDYVSTEGRDLGEFSDGLDPDGVLLDKEGMVEVGKHSLTKCGHCGHELFDYEEGYTFTNEKERVAAQKKTIEAIKTWKDEETPATLTQMVEIIVARLHRAGISCQIEHQDSRILVRHQGKDFRLVVSEV